MSMDGIFIHFLTTELKTKINKSKINKVYQPNPLEIVLQLKGETNFTLLLSASFDAPRIYLTKQTYENPLTPLNFCMVLRKHIERGIITNISQVDNDRIIEICINTYNEMGDSVYYKLIFEIMGRNSNIILINEENIIIDALRKVPPTDTAQRYIIPKAKYIYPVQDNLFNPFITTSCALDLYQGLSTMIKREIIDFYNGDISLFLQNEIKPVIFEKANKTNFYVFPLKGYQTILTFDTISEMLDYYYSNLKKQVNTLNLDLIKQLKRLLNHQQTKLSNLNNDLLKAKENLIYKDLGILLQANLYLVKKGMSSVLVNDFLHNNEEIEIKLDPMLDPSKNLKQIFTKGKKASNALIYLNEQIEKVNDEINYLNDLLQIVEFQTTSELEEIKEELSHNLPQYKQKNKSTKQKKRKINIQHFNFSDVTIYIGKNNIQNDYLTNHLARNNDYWFHVNNASGAHIVVSVPLNNPHYVLTEEIIRLASMLAAYYSSLGKSSSVPVDYTKVQYLKKIPKMKGYHVTYTNQKTIYIDPDFEVLLPYLRK